MPRARFDQAESYPVTYAVLGLLAEWGPMSGYDLKRWFSRGLGAVWDAAQSQIYRELRRLTELGWAVMEREEQEQRPDRKVYAVTEEGRAALVAWHRGSTEPPQIRDELLLKVALGRFAPPEALAASLRQMLAYHEQRLEATRAELRAHSQQVGIVDGTASVAGARSADWHIALVARLGVSYEEMYIRWLRETLAIIEREAESSSSS